MSTQKIYRTLCLFTLLILLFCLAGCGQNTTPTPKPTQELSQEPLVIVKEDHNSLIEIKPGDLIRIQLQALPGAGYSWQISQIDDKVVSLQGDIQMQTDTSGKIGANEYQLFLLKALSPGETTVELIYRRSWETDVEPEEIFTIHVVVLNP